MSKRAKQKLQVFGVELLEGRTLLSATTYHSADGFSTSGNPHGQWTYGSLATLSAAPSSLAVYTTESEVGLGAAEEKWYSDAVVQNPSVFDNLSDSIFSQQSNGSTITLSPDTIDLHPGPDGQYSVAQFSVPTAGTASVDFTYAGIDTEPTTTDVHVLHNGTSVADGGINVDNGVNAFSGTQTFAVAAGDTIDFAVGYGNGMYNYDSTSLSAQITLSTSNASLTPTITRSTLPTAAVGGIKFKGTVQGRLTAAAATTGVSTVALYATTDGVPTDGQMIGELTRKLKLKVGAAFKFSLPVKPVSLAAGSYSVVAVVTDPSVMTTDATVGSIAVTPPSVILATSVLSAVRPATVKPGRAVSAVLSLTNSGNVTSSGAITITYAASTDGTAGDAVSAFETVVRKVQIKPGHITRLPVVFRVPTTLVAGSYYLAVDVSLADVTVGAVTDALGSAGPFTVFSTAIAR